MRTLIEILAGLAILLNAVIYGTDLFGAIILSPAVASVDDRTLTLMSHRSRGHGAETRRADGPAAEDVRRVSASAIAGQNTDRRGPGGATLACDATILLYGVSPVRDAAPLDADTPRISKRIDTTMITKSRRYLVLTGMMLALFCLAASASAASRSQTDFGVHKTTLTHEGVERLLAKGERVKVTSNQAIRWEVRMFVYQRALNRGGLKDPSYTPAGKTWISPNYHLDFTHPGTQWITLHVNTADRVALLRAGTISEGYFSAGYR